MPIIKRRGTVCDSESLCDGCLPHILWRLQIHAWQSGRMTSTKEKLSNTMTNNSLIGEIWCKYIPDILHLSGGWVYCVWVLIANKTTWIMDWYAFPFVRVTDWKTYASLTMRWICYATLCTIIYYNTEKHTAVENIVTWCSIKQLWCYMGIADELWLDVYVAIAETKVLIYVP